MSTHLVKGIGQVLVADNVCVFMEPYNESANIINSPTRHQYRRHHQPWAFVESPKVHLRRGAIVYDVVRRYENLLLRVDSWATSPGI